jgi:hypothetical protein
MPVALRLLVHVEGLVPLLLSRFDCRLAGAVGGLMAMYMSKVLLMKLISREVAVDCRLALVSIRNSQYRGM